MYIYPAIESKNCYITPDEWSVAGINRLNAKEIGKDLNGNVRYGGTPSDLSIIRYIFEMKKRHLKVCFYPMLMMDLQEKPWRGRIFANIENDINIFYNKYKVFILHYAKLLKDKIDAFIIGSEFVKLTSAKFNDQFPFVNKLCELAIEVKSILGENVVVTYAADWSEYHHTEGGIYNMDKLWASTGIDVIGIDAYFPLTNEGKSIYDEEKIIQGWHSGEGYDFYYEDSKRKLNPKPLSPEWAWKNIEYFWNNYHYKSDGTKTEWIAKSKKIWFTEFGFPSVDCCTNQPNVFYSALNDSIESNLPYLSQGYLDFKAQRIAISASIKAWQNSEIVENMFLYCFDARPTNLKNLWKDGINWNYGHWINGKLVSQKVANVVRYLLNKCDLIENEDYDVSLLDFEIGGYYIDSKSTVLSHLQNLANIYLFDIYFQNGKMIFKKFSDGEIFTLSKKDLIVENDIVQFTEEIKPDFQMPTILEFLYINKDKNYTISTITIKDENRMNDIVHGIKTQIAFAEIEANNIAYKILQHFLSRKKYFKLKLSLIYDNIKTNDVIKIENELIRVIKNSKNRK